MILLGLDSPGKVARVERYVREHGIARTFVLSPKRFALPPIQGAEAIEWAEIIQYKFFYRLLQEIDGRTLIVVNECLRTQDRNDLTYNCIRHFLNQTTHQLVFQHLPMIDTFDDFMVLFDFDTRSRWKREKWRPDLLGECRVEARNMAPTFEPIAVETDAKTRAAYAKEKRKLVDGIGLKDPHTIPRNLLLMAGKAKVPHVRAEDAYVGRNNRFDLANLTTYREAADATARTVFELPHNFVDFCDFLAVTRQTTVPALVSDLKVDAWYLDRYQAWARRLRDGYAALHG